MTNNLKSDKFLSNLLGFNSYIIEKKNQLKKFEKLNSFFLIILKSSTNFKLLRNKYFLIKSKSKLLNYKKKIQGYKEIKFKCRFAKKKT